MSEYKHQGRFVWRELLTTDVEGAKGFYGELLNWTFKSSDMGSAGTYWIARVGENEVAGLMTRPAGVEAPSHWSGYVSVDDVDAAVARAMAAGGHNPMPAMTLPGVGRMGLIIDPTGAVSWAFKFATDGYAPGRPALGEFCWESLMSTDVAQSVAFYAKVYGWKDSTFNGMTVFGVGEGMENQVADVSQSPAPAGVPSYWVSNVVVGNAAQSSARAVKLGGKALSDVIDVPTIGKIAIVQDPQGAVLALFEPSPQM